jgi:hypothetical protein
MYSVPRNQTVHKRTFSIGFAVCRRVAHERIFPDTGLRQVVGLVTLLNLAYFGIEFAVALAIGSVSLFADSDCGALDRGYECRFSPRGTCSGEGLELFPFARNQL